MAKFNFKNKLSNRKTILVFTYRKHHILWTKNGATIITVYQCSE